MMVEFRWMLHFIRKSLSPRKALTAFRAELRSWKRFWRDHSLYRRLAPPDRQPSVKHLHPCLGDDTGETDIEPIYFYQDTWAFERIVQQQPQIHIDIASHHKFVALLSMVVPVVFMDIRPLSLPLDTLRFIQGSILDLPFGSASFSSLSCLCVIEHIGLGRYGDPLDPYGTEKAVRELKRVLSPGGNLYVSFPLDDVNKTYFNAHRAFQEEYMLELFEPFIIVQRRYIFGNRFLEQPESGFGTGCYHLRAPQ